jgi:hypothetical protein
MSSAAGDTGSAEATAASQLAAAIATAVVALGTGQLITGAVVSRLAASSGAREIVGRAIELTLAAAPILLLALADAGQLRVRARIEVAKLSGCAAVALAFQAVYDAFSGGVPSPLLTLPLLLATVTGALVGARWLSLRFVKRYSPPAL